MPSLTIKISRRSLIGALILLVAIVPLSVTVYREYRRERLNYDMILTVKQEDSDRVQALLLAGADSRALQSDGDPITARTVVKRSLERLLHLTTHSPRTAPSAGNPGALYLFYRAALDSDYGRHSAPSGTTPGETLPLSLLNSGCDVGAGEIGSYCLYAAVRYHHHNVVLRLLDRGVQCSAKTPIGLMAFMDANSDDAQALIAHGADIEMRDEDGNTALFRAVSLKAVTLLNLNAQIEARNAQGQTPLIFNCAAGNDDAVLVLLARYANVAARDLNGTTPLLAAAAHCRLETIKALVHAGADIQTRKQDGTTVLMYSLYNPDERVFNWLINRSANINAHGMGNNTVLTIAVQLRDQAKAAARPAGRYEAAIRRLRVAGVATYR